MFVLAINSNVGGVRPSARAAGLGSPQHSTPVVQLALSSGQFISNN